MPPPLPFPRFRIWRSARRRWRPATGSLAAMPITPQPPSPSRVRVGDTGGRGSARREARIASARAIVTGSSLAAVDEDVGPPAQLPHASHAERAENILDFPLERFVEPADPALAPFRV